MDDDNIKVYDTRSIQINTYDMADDETVGGKKYKLDVTSYNCAWGDLNYIGFAFD